jgi:GNAT superfamily N-acetyltransferase
MNSSTTNKIRLASTEDAMVLAKLRYEFRASSRGYVVENDAAFIERCARWMHERLRNESYWKCWIAECDATAIGNVWAQLIEKIPNPMAEPEYYVYLTNFYVREEHRGTGIGSRLLAAVLEWTRSKNVQLVILWPAERSRPFYLRNGFSFADDLMQMTVEKQ